MSKNVADLEITNNEGRTIKVVRFSYGVPVAVQLCMQAVRLYEKTAGHDDAESPDVFTSYDAGYYKTAKFYSKTTSSHANGFARWTSKEWPKQRILEDSEFRRLIAPAGESIKVLKHD